ncbi:EamA family transporter [Streptomyces venezuelae]|uniref:EamA family transporter n=1 Tax=Streptomyces venezuelae TaxID=54571 RepID=A0A5P2BPR5_STRVZ|nr:DMT family transporter [Streptomyces venezuelae]QES32323.1 EamA family transporter [Streptomyces venezuelae]
MRPTSDDNKREPAGGVGLIAAAAVLWGTVAPAQLLADTSVDPVTLGACRMLLGGMALGLFTVRVAGLRTLLLPGVRGWMPVSVAVTASFQACFLVAVDRCGAALATAAAFGTVPVVAGLSARRLGGDRLGPRWASATACAVVGLALLLLPGAGARVDAAGVALGCVAGASFGVYIALTRRIAVLGADPSAAAPVSVVCAGLLVSPWLAVRPDGLARPESLLLVGYLGLATTALGYLLFTKGVARVSGATAGTLSLIEPLVAAGLGVVLLGERPGLLAAAGAALLLGGLVVTSMPSRGRGEAERRKEPRLRDDGGSCHAVQDRPVVTGRRSEGG